MLIGLLALVYTNAELTEPKEVMEKKIGEFSRKSKHWGASVIGGGVCPSEVWYNFQWFFFLMSKDSTVKIDRGPYELEHSRAQASVWGLFFFFIGSKGRRGWLLKAVVWVGPYFGWQIRSYIHFLTVVSHPIMHLTLVIWYAHPIYIGIEGK